MFEERHHLNMNTLKQQTEEEHRAAERGLPLMRPGLDSTDYAHCLKRLYGVVAAWEELAPVLAPAWLRALLIPRQRRTFLDHDLAWFGITAPHGRAPLPALQDLPSLLGAMYVMEGSTLGGQIIARHVQTSLALTPGCGNAFFRGHGSQTGLLWKEFCEMLTTRVPDDQTHQVVTSAKATFAIFGAWMQEKSVLHDG